MFLIQIFYNLLIFYLLSNPAIFQLDTFVEHIFVAVFASIKQSSIPCGHLLNVFAKACAKNF